MRRSWVEFTRRHGIDIDVDEMLRAHDGPHRHRMHARAVRRATSSDDEALAPDRREGSDLPRTLRAASSPRWPGFRAFAAGARERGLKVGVGTAGDRHNIAFALVAPEAWTRRRDAVVGGDEGLPGKPEPAIFLEAARPHRRRARAIASCSRMRPSASKPRAAPACARWPCAPRHAPANWPARTWWRRCATTTNS